MDVGALPQWYGTAAHVAQHGRPRDAEGQRSLPERALSGLERDGLIARDGTGAPGLP